MNDNEFNRRARALARVPVPRDAEAARAVQDECRLLIDALHRAMMAERRPWWKRWIER